MVEGHARQAFDRLPGGVRRYGLVDVAGDEPEVGGRELPLARISVRVAPGAELFEVRELAHVDLGGEVAADRLLERLGGVEVAAGQGPGTGVGFLRALPEHDLERVVAHL